MDKKLLLDIFQIPAQSGEEEKMRDFIIKFLQFEEIPYTVDSVGNVYNITCTTRPLLNAHMDTMQNEVDGIFQKFAKIYNNQFLKGYGIIGADDKCGIYIILELLKTNEFNFLFTVQEESGCIGSNYFINNKEFSYIPYGITFDRCGASDILCVQNDYGTKKFENVLEKIGKPFGYKPARGVFSDADQISEQISTCNLSVGYYGHHTKGEFVDIIELENAVNFTQAILDNVEEKFEAPEKTYGSGFYRYGYKDFEVGYDYDANYSKEELEELDRLTTPSTQQPVCFITSKNSDKLTYIDALKHFVSPEGARILYEELESSGIAYEMYDNKYDEEIAGYCEELEEGYERTSEER